MHILLCCMVNRYWNLFEIINNMNYAKLRDMSVSSVKCMLFSYSNEHSSASDGAILHGLCDICDEILYIKNVG